MKSFFQLFNLLSLDVAFGAMCMAWFVAAQFHLQIPFVYFILLAQTVWSIYLLDHLYDTKKGETASLRKVFFKKYAMLLWAVLMMNSMVLILLFAFNFNLAIVKWSIIPVLLTSIYILLNWRYQKLRRPFYAKEIFIAGGYTSGIMVLPLSFLISFHHQFWIFSAAIFCTAAWNVLVIAVFEKKSNDLEGQTTISQWMSMLKIKATTISIWLLFLGIVISNILLYQPPLKYGLVWGMMGIYMAVPFILPQWMTKYERYNKWVEQIFLIPGIYFLIEGVSNGIFGATL